MEPKFYFFGAPKIKKKNVEFKNEKITFKVSTYQTTVTTILSSYIQYSSNTLKKKKKNSHSNFTSHRQWIKLITLISYEQVLPHIKKESERKKKLIKVYGIGLENPMSTKYLNFYMKMHAK